MKKINKELYSKVFNSATLNTWASIGVRTLNLIVLIPFILKKFDASEITIWYLFSTVMSFNFVFDMGFSTTFIRGIAYGMGGANSLGSKEANGQPNIEFLSKIWRNIRVIYLFLTLIVLVAISTLGSWVVLKPISLLINDRDGWIAWCFVVFGTVLTFWGNIFSIYLQGVNKIAILRRFETIFSLCSIFSSIIVIQVGWGFLSLVIVNQFWNVMSITRNLWICNKDIIYIEINKRFTFDIDKELLNEIWSSSWKSAIGVLMSYGIINSTTVFFAQSDDSASSASYLFSFRILQVLINFSMAPFYSKIPLLSKMYVIGNYNELTTIAKKGMRLSHLSFVLPAIIIGIIAPFAINLLHSNVEFLDKKIWSVLILAYFIERFGAMHIQLYSVTNIIIWHIANSITGVILFLLLYFLIPKYGYYAFPISMLIAYSSFYSWFAAGKSYSHFKIKFIDFEATVALPALLIVLMYLAYSFFL